MAVQVDNLLLSDIGRSISLDTATRLRNAAMSKLIRQVSIETPAPKLKDCVLNLVVPVPDTPAQGARILVVYAGACYRKNQSTSISSISSQLSDTGDITTSLHLLAKQMQSGSFTSISEEGPDSTPAQHHQTSVAIQHNPQAHQGVRDGALFPGFEVAGVIESLGSELKPDCGFKVGQRVILYPYEGVPHGYSELMVVPDLKYLIPIPDELSLSVAATLPTGALLAQSAIIAAHKIVDDLLKSRPGEKVKILIVGTGGLALWAVRIAAQHFYTPATKDKIQITVASLRDEGFLVAKKCERVNIVQWNEDLYEKQLIERTHDACDGLVDIVIDFGTTSRSLHRSMQCLTKGGHIFISDEVAEKLLPKFSKRAEERGQTIEAVPTGTVEQLHQLVKLVSSNEIEPPPHSVFPSDQAAEVVRKLASSEIPGRAILKFHDIE
uniref:Enoyl reductase (ER) domain-containing protein n=1 Tax=Anopheles dirus TaxID=7168 RepID=A0A182NF80_9DIPT